MTLDPETVREEGITKDELMEKHFLDTDDPAMNDVVYHDEWDEFPEERPADVSIEEREDGTRVLSWTYEDCELRVWNEALADWVAEIDIPHAVSCWMYGPGGFEHEIKRRFVPHIGDHREGYVEAVEKHDDVPGSADGNAIGATIRCRCTTNYQPMSCLEAMIDEMWAHAEETQENTERMKEVFEAAEGNET